MSLFKNDGNNPLVAIGMVIGLAIVPTLILGGLVGGAAWLGWLGVKAAIALATTGSAAGILTPGVVLGAIAGGGALLLAGSYTGANEAFVRIFKEKILGKNPDAPRKSAQPSAPPSASWVKMCKDLNARKGFNAAQKDKEPEQALPPTPKPPDIKAP